ncbi:MAG: acyl carrier protein phosphodiesterase [Cyclobacteriaceae bacterium]|jgi:acyl carrier protein phosphodiesterase
MDAQQANTNIKKAIKTYVDNIWLELRERWNQWPKDLTQKELHEVIGGIMSRQVAIMTNYSSNSSLWNNEMAPIILRSMVDNYINMAWIAMNPLERSQKFILHGLGQAKLQIEHRKKQLEQDGINSATDPMVEATESWINTQRYTFLTEVNLGSWSGLNTRTMAEEAGCIDLYNYVYQPFSTAAHNMWNHISRYNLIQSENPFHKFMLTPTLGVFDAELEYFELGAKYVDKLFHLFDTTFDHEPKIKSSYEIVADQIDKTEIQLRNSKEA